MSDFIDRERLLRLWDGLRNATHSDVTIADLTELIDNAPDAAPSPALTREALAAALRATGALWSTNDYYEVTTDAEAFADAILAALSKVPPPSSTREETP